MIIGYERKNKYSYPPEVSKKGKSVEYPEKSGIKIRKVPNKTGGKTYGSSYQVNIPTKFSGGKRIRINCPTEKMAKKEAAKQYRGIVKQGEAYFKLTPEEQQEIGLLAPKLRGKGISLTEAIGFALRHLRPSCGEKLLSEVIDELQEAKRSWNAEGELADKSLSDFISKSNRLKKDLGDNIIYEIKIDLIKS